MDVSLVRSKMLVPVAALVATNGVVVTYEAAATFAPTSGGLATAVVEAVFGVLLLYLAYGLWSAEAWAWLTIIVVEGINAIFSTVTLVFALWTITAWLTLVLALAILALLAQPTVRGVFGRRSARS